MCIRDRLSVAAAAGRDKVRRTFIELEMIAPLRGDRAYAARACGSGYNECAGHEKAPARESRGFLSSDAGLQSRVVDIADRALAVEGFRVRFVQRRIGLQAGWQVRVGDEGHTKGHGVSLASGQPGVGAVLGEAFVGDVGAAEGFFELRAQAVGCLLYTSPSPRDS